MPGPQIVSNNKVLEIVDKRIVCGTLAVSPSTIEFKDIQAGSDFSKVIVVQNLAIEPKKIRVTLQSSTPGIYSLENVSTSEAFTAPYGLDKKVVLKFRPKEDKDYPAKIIIK